MVLQRERPRSWLLSTVNRLGLAGYNGRLMPDDMVFRYIYCVGHGRESTAEDPGHAACHTSAAVIWGRDAQPRCECFQNVVMRIECLIATCPVH